MQSDPIGLMIRSTWQLKCGLHIVYQGPRLPFKGLASESEKTGYTQTRYELGRWRRWRRWPHDLWHSRQESDERKEISERPIASIGAMSKSSRGSCKKVLQIELYPPNHELFYGSLWPQSRRNGAPQGIAINTLPSTSVWMLIGRCVA